MTEKVKPARLVGGPLDGREYKPATRWPHYLSDEGEILPPRKGDRIFGRQPVRIPPGWPQSCYILRMDPTNWTRSYVHSTVED